MRTYPSERKRVYTFKQTSPNYPAERKLRERHNMTWEQFEEILESQDGVCAICRQECRQNERLSVDHDHETGEVRGLLCNDCNLGLGRFKDDISILQGALLYLRGERNEGGQF